MSDSVQPQSWQPTRLLCPWDSPSKRVGCHFLLQCMRVKSESEVVQSCPTLCDPMDCSPSGSYVHGTFPGKSTGVGCHCLLLSSSYTFIICGTLRMNITQYFHKHIKLLFRRLQIKPGRLNICFNSTIS